MNTSRLLAPLLIACLASMVEAGDAQKTDLEQEARALVGEFVGQLKPHLKQALQSGGPVHAIDVCSHEAPRIADALSVESGWTVKRVSLQTRNASRAQPDHWEQAVLQQFDQRQSAGEQPMDINFSEATKSRYRYMQAQGVEGVCLLCHGEAPSAEVVNALQEYYPDDTATGYSLGQVRGAISLSRQLP